MINTVKHLCYVLHARQTTIEYVLENIDKFYYEKPIIKLNKEGQPKKDANNEIIKRFLYPSKKELKELQKRIKLRILNKIILPDYAFGGVKGRDNVKNAYEHQGKQYNFTTDLKGYYPSISHKMVFQMFLQHGYSHEISRILTKLTTYKGMLPQGTPTSPMIANLIFINTGKDLQEIIKLDKIIFTTYVDDLTFSSAKNFKSLIPEILNAIKINGFRISHNKTNYKTKNPVVTGIMVKNNSLNITKEFQKKLDQETDTTSSKYIGMTNYKKRVNNYKG